MGGGAVYTAALAVPALSFLATSEEPSSGSERWIRLAPLASLSEDAPNRVKIVGEQRDSFTIARGQTLGSVWIVRKGDDLRALSAECPHLGCAIDMAGDGKSFSCPCHTSRFTLDGTPEDGPSPRQMDELATRVVDGWVEVDFRRYRQGSAEKVELG
jgi:cytochrome b6-f complex iron-sulfur subunit/menaquinol-cytochrome c reductase iron-sulfur subunit